MTLELKALLLFFVLLVVGYALAAGLYAKKKKRFRGSDLQKKTLFWIPIFIVFLVFAASGTVLRGLIIGMVIAGIAIETERRLKKTKNPAIVISYAVTVAVELTLKSYLYHAT